VAAVNDRVHPEPRPAPAVAPSGVASVAPSVATPPAPTCTVRSFVGPAGETINAVLDPSGTYIAGYYQSGEIRHALLWQRGAPTELHPPGAAPTPMDVNAEGMVAGRSQRDGRSIGWLRHGSTYTELKPPTGAREVFVNGLNGRGDVAGEAIWSDRHSKAVVWAFGSSTPAVLPTANAAFASANAIGEDGTAYGSAGDGDMVAAWPPGRAAQPLPGLDGDHVGKVFRVAGQWAMGVGSAAGTGLNEHARWVLWNLAKPTATPTAPLGLPYAESVNARGWLAGYTDEGRPAIVRDGRLIPLPGLDGDDGDGVASDLSDDGTIIIGTVDKPSGTVSVEWHC
jgi:hypothetical protein